MLDLGWQELFFITLVAIIVVGPKDLPMLVRSISRWIFKARRLAQDFQGSLEIVAREAEIDGLKKDMVELVDDAKKDVLPQDDDLLAVNIKRTDTDNLKKS
ncbi:Sec-independent protein translocase protein TatB [Alphaproteobacteria bacterium]|nr:Sec-independent protein translocase protein TatB [Alphaproteobacteria bacterium]|tara:strand:- start:87 stop:389 length:303 start_codon:yes stop_codon:yes gene_type:complete